MDIVKLLLEYGWQVVVLGILGSLAIGAIKSPIYIALKKKYTDTESAAYSKMQNIFDTVVFISTFVMAFVVAFLYLFFTKAFTWGSFLSVGIAVWMTETVVYGMWKKLGIKRVLLILLEKIKNVFSRLFDKNQDGKVSFDEATSTIKDFMSGGKLDIEKVLNTAGEVATDVVTETVKQVVEESGDAGKVDPKEEIDKLKDAVKDVTQEVFVTGMCADEDLKKEEPESVLVVAEDDIKEIEGVDEIPEGAEVYDELKVVSKEQPVVVTESKRISVINLKK